MKYREKLRFAIKCIGYAPNLKINLISIGILFLVGGLNVVIDALGFWAILIVAMFPSELLHTLGASRLVQSSPRYKALTTSLPVLLTMGSSILLYLLMVVCQFVWMAAETGRAEKCVDILIVSGLLLMFIGIYDSIVFKYEGSILLMIIYMAGIYYYMISDGRVFSRLLPGLSPLAAAVAGLCLVLLGGGLQYCISLRSYRRPLTKRVLRTWQR